MYLKQSDLLWGLDKKFIQEFIEAGLKETHPKGYILFKEGEPADYFFIMMKGCISLNLGGQHRTAYLVNHAGEAFGWSSLVGMDKYTATAECLEESMYIRFAKEFIGSVTEADPVNGMRFYRRLARMIGMRLMHSYHLETETSTDELKYAFGTGQSIESYTTP